METKRLVQQIETFFSRRDRGLAAVYLYGSFARGTQRADSDVDVGLLVHEADPSRRIQFEVLMRQRYLDLLPALREYRRGSSKSP